MPLSTQAVPKSYRTSDGGYTPRGPERWKRARINAHKRPNSRHAKLFQQRLDTATHVVDTFKQSFINSPWTDNGHIFAFSRTSWDYNVKSSADREYKVQYYACSIECAVMQLQLDVSMWNGDEVETLRMVLLALSQDDNDVLPTFGFRQMYMIEQKAPERGVRCNVCGDKIEADARLSRYWEGDLAPIWKSIEEFLTETTATDELMIDAGFMGNLTPEPVVEVETAPQPVVDHTFFINVNDGTIVMPSSLRRITVSDREGMLLLEANNETVARFGQKYGEELS
jgi:hypothetical protein